MTRHILIDLDNLKMLAATDGKDALRRCEYLADILIPNGEYYVCGTEKRDLNTFTSAELRLLFNNHSARVMGTQKRDYEAVELLADMMDKMKLSEESLEDLVKKLGRPLSEQSLLPVAEKIKSVAPSSATPSRPKDGTMTVRAWEAADYLYSKQVPKDLDSKDLRNDVIKACVANGVHPSTAATQFSKWKRDQKES